MGKDLKIRLLVILAVIGLSIFYTFPIQKRINLGLDLKGGMHLILKVETEKLNPEARHDAVLRAIEILRNRIDSLGVGETVIQQQGENAILVQLPGVTDRQAALEMVGRVAQLEFRLVSDNPTLMSQALQGTTPKGFILKTIKKEGGQQVLIEEAVAMSGENIADAKVDFDSASLGQPYISLTFNSKGASEFGAITQKNVGRRLAIILDGEVLSAPTINEVILGGQAQLTGQFTYEEAALLGLALRSGALPAPMHVEEERTIGPLLGKDSIASGINAAIYAGIFVLAFMVIYYLGAGVISGLALAMNILIIFGAMGLLSVLSPESKLTLTLPGIAGIILTIGMAVDANVLINERIREELKLGRPLRAAIDAGYEQALRAIIDSNVTTLIAAFMLFQFGSGPIKGFAVTLTMGLVASLFTAVYVTRTFFRILVDAKIIKSLPMLSLFGETKIDFISKRHICYVLSLGVVIASIVALAQKKDTAYGIDFAGGEIQEYRFKEPVHADRLRDVLKDVGLSDAVIQQFDANPENVIIRTSGDTYNVVEGALRQNFADNSFEILRVEKVGPVVGKALRKAALFAMVLALAGILIYVGFRFKHFDFATAGVIALLHDVFVTLGVAVMTNRQIDLLMVSALLTIAGFSINDTIIIYDRVRENIAKFKKMSLKDVINLSLNQMLARSILTNFTALLVVVTLFLKGGEVLNTFSFCLMVGFLVGTYSTIYIVSPLVLMWQKNK